MDGIARQKQALRQAVWDDLEERGAVEPGGHGRIPEYFGAPAAAERLAALALWKQARVVKANADRSQYDVRLRALAENKLLYVSDPRLREQRPFAHLDPATLQQPAEAAAAAGPEQADERSDAGALKPIDLVICSSVAVNRDGARLGEGGGHRDLELALLIEAGLVTDDTLIVAPVHERQVIHDEIPEDEHDVSVDLIVTPTHVYRSARHHRPAGIRWSLLDESRIESSPSLAAMHRLRAARSGSR